jgi:hypothetical protein
MTPNLRGKPKFHRNRPEANSLSNSIPFTSGSKSYQCVYMPKGINTRGNIFFAHARAGGKLVVQLNPIYEWKQKLPVCLHTQGKQR